MQSNNILTCYWNIHIGGLG